ncbi:MAG: DEAD/DEAH box helicase [Burkholderiales bacterium]|nr:DEAD/DEAH box helicase [Bacteroidia bacterium]
MFKEKLNKKLAALLSEHGFEEPLEMQLKCIPKINGGSDVIGIGPEGCGKSSTIIISAIQKLTAAFEDAPRALIIVADEAKVLAMLEQFKLLSYNTDLRAEAVFEGGKIDKQTEAIYFGTDIVIGTPKRVMEIYFKKNFNLNKIKLFVIDDAEMAIKNAAHGQIDRMALSLPKCQHLVFANELNEKIEKLIEKFIVAPVIVKIEA